jgi:YD repeat-containing protein
MSDRDEAGFHGQVKRCIEETVYPPGGKFSATTEYSLDGRHLTVRNSQGDGSESVLTYAYDGAGRSLSITSNLNSDRPTFATTNTAA